MQLTGRFPTNSVLFFFSSSSFLVAFSLCLFSTQYSAALFMSDSDAVLFFFFFFMAVSCSFSSSSASWRPPSLRTAQKKNCYSQDFSAAVGKLRDSLLQHTSFLPFLQLLLSRRLLFWLRLFLLRLTWLIFDVCSVSLLLLLYAALDRLKQQHISGMFKKKV